MVMSSQLPDASAVHGGPAENSDGSAAVHHPAHVDPRLHRLREVVPVAACLAVAAVVLFQVNNINERIANNDLGPRYWPITLAWFLVAMASAVLVEALVRRRPPADLPEPVNRIGLMRILATGAILIGYLSLWNVLQWWLITLAATVALAYLYGARGWRALVLFPAIVTAVLHFLFIVALRVPL